VTHLISSNCVGCDELMPNPQQQLQQLLICKPMAIPDEFCTIHHHYQECNYNKHTQCKAVAIVEAHLNWSKCVGGDQLKPDIRRARTTRPLHRCSVQSTATAKHRTTINTHNASSGNG